MHWWRRSELCQSSSCLLCRVCAAECGCLDTSSPNQNQWGTTDKKKKEHELIPFCTSATITDTDTQKTLQKKNHITNVLCVVHFVYASNFHLCGNGPWFLCNKIIRYSTSHQVRRSWITCYYILPTYTVVYILRAMIQTIYNNMYTMELFWTTLNCWTTVSVFSC